MAEILPIRRKIFLHNHSIIVGYMLFKSFGGMGWRELEGEAVMQGKGKKSNAQNRETGIFFKMIPPPSGCFLLGTIVMDN